MAAKWMPLDALNCATSEHFGGGKTMPEFAGAASSFAVSTRRLPPSASGKRLEYEALRKIAATFCRLYIYF